MAGRLREKKVKSVAFISSPAKRAKKTAIAFAREFGKGKDEIILKEELYVASDNAFSSVIASAKNKHDTIAVFSHNPGITEFANSLTEVKVDNMPTCSIFAVKIDTDDWSHFVNAKKEFWFFEYPKKTE